MSALLCSGRLATLLAAIAWLFCFSPSISMSAPANARAQDEEVRLFLGFTLMEAFETDTAPLKTATCERLVGDGSGSPSSVNRYGRAWGLLLGYSLAWQFQYQKGKGTEREEIFSRLFKGIRDGAMERVSMKLWLQYTNFAPGVLDMALWSQLLMAAREEAMTTTFTPIDQLHARVRRIARCLGRTFPSPFPDYYLWRLRQKKQPPSRNSEAYVFLVFALKDALEEAPGRSAAFPHCRGLNLSHFRNAASRRRREIAQRFGQMKGALIGYALARQYPYASRDAGKRAILRKLKEALQNGEIAAILAGGPVFDAFAFPASPLSETLRRLHADAAAREAQAVLRAKARRKEVQMAADCLDRRIPEKFPDYFTYRSYRQPAGPEAELIQSVERVLAYWRKHLCPKLRLPAGANCMEQPLMQTAHEILFFMKARYVREVSSRRIDAFLRYLSRVKTTCGFSGNERKAAERKFLTCIRAASDAALLQWNPEGACEDLWPHQTRVLQNYRDVKWFLDGRGCRRTDTGRLPPAREMLFRTSHCGPRRGCIVLAIHPAGRPTYCLYAPQPAGLSGRAGGGCAPLRPSRPLVPAPGMRPRPARTSPSGPAAAAPADAEAINRLLRR